ncbi:MAG: hypothetical protein M3245_05795 [Actinomycetota bacterium]|nr:hypothetical protein [Actinomycetota bacterium]
MQHRTRSRTLPLALGLIMVASLATLVTGHAPVVASVPVARDEATYAAYGRVFPDPQGCLAHDTDGDGVNDVVPPRVSPWAKGNVCAIHFLQYEDVIEGTKFLARKFPRFLQVIRLDQAFDNPEFMSAGLPRSVVLEDGKPKALSRDRRPLYLFKVTDAKSPIPERDRLHFVYAGGIHGPERAGAEGAVRAMEDLITWATSMPDKKIVEAPTEKPVPTARESLERSVIYFMLPNPDGWARGQIAPVEFEDGAPNLNYTPGLNYQRYNGNGVDLNRDWPTAGYTYRPYSPGSEPETKAYAHALRRIAKTTSAGRFAGGIDLHGQLVANAFSYTLLGSGQRDFRKNFSTVDQSMRTWEDQTARLAWSPYIGTVFPVADQWGTVIDTIGYQVTGSLGDWMESDIVGLGAVGIDNEMSLSHVAPGNAFEPVLEQMHIDGNKGLIYSQLASMISEERFVYDPPGKIGYVFNPRRITHEGKERTPNPGMPAQNDLDVIVPCQSAGPQTNDALLPCKEPGVEFRVDGTSSTLEFDVEGPDRGMWNGGITVTMTNTHAGGVSPAAVTTRVSLDHLVEGQWQTAATSLVSEAIYANAGQIVTVDDPMPGRWRARLTSLGSGPARLKIDFSPYTAEENFGQRPFSASSMDFFDDLNEYIADPAEKAEGVTVQEVIADPSALDRFDSLVVVNDPFPAYADEDGTPLNVTRADENAYFAALRGFAEAGGNLVLTDGALRALPAMGVVSPDDVRTGKVLAGRYNFSVSGRGNVCNVDPLAREVCLPGTAGGTSRQAVEPTPLGYSPSGDSTAFMPQWGVRRTAWEAGCGKAPANLCTSAIVLEAGLGERRLGGGVVRIAGALFPDPNYMPGAQRDMRFGVASYALTFSSWQVFLNLMDYRRA